MATRKKTVREIVDLVMSAPTVYFYTGSPAHKAAIFTPREGALVTKGTPGGMAVRPDKVHAERIQKTYDELAKSADIGVLILRCGTSKRAVLDSVERYLKAEEAAVA
jgi:hypothetical protein